MTDTHDAHPTPYALEAFSVGEDEGGVAEHVAGCPACKAYVDGLGATQAAFLAEEPSERFLHRPAVAAELNRPEPEAPARRWVGWFAGLGLAAAAALALIAVPSSGPAPVDEVRLKGASALEVVRERAGAQAVFRDEVSVRPGDRLRIRLVVAAPAEVTAGLLEPDGTWTALTSGQRFEAGVHWLHADALIVEPGLAAATVLAGEAAAVAVARTGAEAQGVVRCRVVVEASSSP